MFTEEESDGVFFDEQTTDSNVFGELSSGGNRPKGGIVKSSEGNGRSLEGRGYTGNSSEGRGVQSSIESRNAKPPVKGVYPVKKANTPSVKAKMNSTHDHPAGNGSTLVERKSTYVGSLGAVSDEGCIEHGDERYIKTTTPTLVGPNVTHNRLREYVIAKEVLGKPKCRK